MWDSIHPREKMSKTNLKKGKKAKPTFIITLSATKPCIHHIQYSYFYACIVISPPMPWLLIQRCSHTSVRVQYKCSTNTTWIKHRYNINSTQILYKFKTNTLLLYWQILTLVNGLVANPGMLPHLSQSISQQAAVSHSWSPRQPAIPAKIIPLRLYRLYRLYHTYTPQQT